MGFSPYILTQRLPLEAGLSSGLYQKTFARIFFLKKVVLVLVGLTVSAPSKIQGQHVDAHLGTL